MNKFLIAGLFFCGEIKAQEKLYPNTFPLGQVTLLEGPFSRARDLNVHVLLAYDVDRLLAPYLKEAGLKPKKTSYKNWEGLDGHIAGHYLTALALNYASTRDPECKRRMDYMVAELKACQQHVSAVQPDWAKGYVGGVPGSSQIWSGLKRGDFKAYRNAWVPWYNVHKMFAGLRDAWAYGGNQDAKEVFLKFCDWAIDLTSGLSEGQMQAMLDTEHGGMNEELADAYEITGDQKYLIAAKRFSHQQLLKPMSEQVDNLDNKHANTQVPKVVGFQRIAELSHDVEYEKSGSFFWETVTNHRTLAFGGNSRREFFPTAAAGSDFINDVEGPESCNTYNMLKLTQGLFRAEPLAKYADFYEKALYNHILSTQHPEHGGYVYFTPARPRHYRVYSAPNEAMWCCVGSGMENHGKYNEFIYTHRKDSLYLNLFIASELNWKDKRIKLKQETAFPDQEKTKLSIIEGAAKFTLMLRYPSWMKEGAMQILVNGKTIKYKKGPSSYVAIERNWKKGDVIKVTLPMQTTIERMPNVSEYVAIMHGPILLAAKTKTEALAGLIADDSRWGHIAAGQKLPLDKAPIIIEENFRTISKKIKAVKDHPMTFSFANEKIINPERLVLEPFYRIHDSRYMMYWMTLTPVQYVTYLDSVAGKEREKLALEKRTVDFVAPGEQQPEIDHAMQIENSRTGSSANEFWREAFDGGYFSYQLSTRDLDSLSLHIRYQSTGMAGRQFEIYIDDQKFKAVDHTAGFKKSGFYNEAYPIPAAMLKGKQQVRVKFLALPGKTTDPVYHVRLVSRK
ncbi:glycoside hydrolase family 127 protein [Pedobacter sp. LMG 31643]|nr:glycoside hydrolase family 127 protein [Pedobacter foliorum]